MRTLVGAATTGARDGPTAVLVLGERVPQEQVLAEAAKRIDSPQGFRVGGYEPERSVPFAAAGFQVARRWSPCGSCEAAHRALDSGNTREAQFRVTVKRRRS